MYSSGRVVVKFYVFASTSKFVLFFLCSTMIATTYNPCVVQLQLTTEQADKLADTETDRYIEQMLRQTDR